MCGSCRPSEVSEIRVLEHRPREVEDGRCRHVEILGRDGAPRHPKAALSCALIHGSEEWSDLDLRVDDHADPLAELARLELVSRER